MLNKIYQALVRMLAGLGLLVVVVTFTPLVPWWAGRLAGSWEEPKGDVLIVLGGSSSRDGIIGESSYLRAQYAVTAYRQDGFHTVVLTGAGRPIPVATSMRDFMACQGVPASAMLSETASTSTRENALNSRSLLANLPGRKVLLSSDYHMFRACRVFRKLGLAVTPRPVPDAVKRATQLRGRWPAFLDLLLETAKIGYYYARGWI